MAFWNDKPPAGFDEATKEREREEERQRVLQAEASNEQLRTGSYASRYAQNVSDRNARLAAEGKAAAGAPGAGSGGPTTPLTSIEQHQTAASDAIGEMTAMFNQNMGTLAEGQGLIDESFGEKQKQVTQDQSLLARRASEMSAVRGQSMGGGASQAGAAQASIAGSRLMGEAYEQKLGQQMELMNRMVAQRESFAGKMLSWGQMNLDKAASAEEAEKARAAIERAQMMQMDNDAFVALVSSGQIENPDELIRIFNERTGGAP